MCKISGLKKLYINNNKSMFLPFVFMQRSTVILDMYYYNYKYNLIKYNFPPKNS